MFLDRRAAQLPYETSLLLFCYCCSSPKESSAFCFGFSVETFTFLLFSFCICQRGVGPVPVERSITFTVFPSTSFSDCAVSPFLHHSMEMAALVSLTRQILRH